MQGAPISVGAALSEDRVREFVCKVCGEKVRALGLEVWHRCQGKWRELTRVSQEDEWPPSTTS